MVRRLANLANLATAAATEDGARFRIHAPLRMLSKAGIVRLALELGVPVALGVEDR